MLQIFVKLFCGCEKLPSIPSINVTSKVTTLENTFRECKLITAIPQMNTVNVTSISMFCVNDINLVDVPLLDTSSMTNMNEAFINCPSLSNTSLNNILAMCTNATNIITSNKTLRYIGLSQAQTQICTTLSNYQAFVNAGWTTGY